MIYLAIALYLSMFSVANFAVYHLGVWSMPFNAFLIIGLDYLIRELVHVRIGSLMTMGMVFAAAAISLLVSPGSIMISVAATASFSVSSLISTVLMLRIGAWKSVMACCAVDSIMFPTIAFCSLMVVPILVQFSAKFGGYLFWKFLYGRLSK